MRKPSLEKIMVMNYTRVIRELLLSQFRDDERLTPLFQSRSVKQQREIEEEIERRSKKAAVRLVAELKKRGGLETEPAQKELKEMIVQALLADNVKT